MKSLWGNPPCLSPPMLPYGFPHKDFIGPMPYHLTPETIFTRGIRVPTAITASVDSVQIWYNHWNQQKEEKSAATSHCCLSSSRVTSSRVTSRPVTSRRVTSRRVTRRRATSRRLTYSRVTSSHVTSICVTSSCVTSSRVTSSRVTSSHVTTSDAKLLKNCATIGCCLYWRNVNKQKNRKINIFLLPRSRPFIWYPYWWPFKVFLNVNKWRHLFTSIKQTIN
jgi:hypothetical protein